MFGGTPRVNFRKATPGSRHLTATAVG